MIKGQRDRHQLFNAKAASAVNPGRRSSSKDCAAALERIGELSGKVTAWKRSKILPEATVDGLLYIRVDNKLQLYSGQVHMETQEPSVAGALAGLACMPVQLYISYTLAFERERHHQMCSSV